MISKVEFGTGSELGFPMSPPTGGQILGNFQLVTSVREGAVEDEMSGTRRVENQPRH